MSAFDILAVGDVAACRREPATILAHVAPLLRSAPVVFGQLEAPVSARGAPNPVAKLAMRCPPRFAHALGDAGFTLMSAAGNHCLDYGPEALSDTPALLPAAGVALAGAGDTLEAALAPAIQTLGCGAGVALVAASSILPSGYAASPNTAGCVPIWAHTTYESIEPDQPATPPRVISRADSADLNRLVGAVRDARQQADLVLVSLHWGIHMITGVIADYQREVARALVAAGASAILGHHPHLLKGIEFIDGVPVFYSLGNFAIEQPQAFDPAIVESKSFRHLLSLNAGSSPESLYVLPPETRLTGIARLEVESGRIARVRFHPCRAADDSSPVPLDPADSAFREVHAYLERVTAIAGLNAQFRVEDGTLRVT